MNTIELPLFPLRTVLFPGGRLALKVFEQRYLQMTRACLREQRAFGVCLLTQGNEVGGPDAGSTEFAPIGTTCRIDECDVHETGILQLATRGESRFRVLEHRTEADGLAMARVELLAPEPATPLDPAQAPAAQFLRTLIERVGALKFPAPIELDDASWVGYRLAEVLPLPLPIKQSMLEVNGAEVRLRLIAGFLAKHGLT